MNFKKIGILGGGTLLLALLIFIRPLGFIDAFFYDLHFAFKTKPAAQGPAQTQQTSGLPTAEKPVVIVGIDGASIDEVGSWPWPRAKIGQLISSISSYSPKATAIDISFSERTETDPNDDSLAAALCAARNIVLPFKIGSISSEPDREVAVIPTDVFAHRFRNFTNKEQLNSVLFYNAQSIQASAPRFVTCAKTSGFINVSTSRTSQKIREVIHVVRAGNEYFPSFCLAALSAYYNLPTDSMILNGTPAALVGPCRVPLTGYAATAHLNFAGPAGSIPTISAADIMNGKTDPALLRDKLVFVGVTDPGAMADYFTTPVGSTYPGVEIWATAAQNCIDKTIPLEDNPLAGAGQWLVALFLFPGLALLVPYRKKILAIGAGTLLVAASFAAGQLLFTNANIFWSPASHLYAWLFAILWIALQKGDSTLIELAPIDFIPPQQSNRDVVAPPTPDSFFKELPATTTLTYAAGQRFAISQTVSSTTQFSNSGVTHAATPPPKLTPQQLKEIGAMAEGNVVKVLGSGGMADVYLVWKPALEVYRAVKVIRPDQSQNILERFETESKILSKLSHPHIVQLYTVGQWNGLPFIEMEYVPGTSCDTMLDKGGVFSVTETLAIGICVCRALHFAHGMSTAIHGKTYHGVIHRDLKPANILISRGGQVKLADFGIARPKEVHLHTEETTSIVGTLPYLAPEQLDDKPLTPRTDIYALGATLYELLAGKRAFPQREMTSLINAKAIGKIEPLPGTGLQQDVSRIISKALAYEPGDRYESAHAMGVAMEQLLRRMLTKQQGYEVLAICAQRHTGAV